MLIVSVFYDLCSFCDIRNEFRIKKMFGLSLPPVVCRMARVDLRNLFMFGYSGVQHILCGVFALFFFGLCTLCCQCLLIVLFLLHLRYSLTFIYRCKRPEYQEKPMISVMYHNF